MAQLPDVKEGDTGTIVDTEISKGMTKAPPYLTPGTLVEFMENCGSLMEEKEMQKSKMAVWGRLTNSYEKKRSEKQRRKGKI